MKSENGSVRTPLSAQSNHATVNVLNEDVVAIHQRHAHQWICFSGVNHNSHGLTIPQDRSAIDGERVDFSVSDYSLSLSEPAQAAAMLDNWWMSQRLVEFKRWLCRR